MLDETNSQDNMLGQQFAEGTPVYDVNGNKVGTVNGQSVQGDNLVLQKGLFFPHDYYVPLRTIMHTDADGIYLNVTKDDVTNQKFDSLETGGNLGGVSAFSDTTIPYQNAEYEVFGNRPAGDIYSGTDSISQPANSDIEMPMRESEARVPVREEQFTVDQQQTEVGRARIHKDVIEEPQMVNVPTTHEEWGVEHVPVQGDVIAVGPDAFTERDIDIPLRGEEVVAKKVARVAEEVRLRKRHVTENQRVAETVRKERVRIEGAGIDQGESDVPPGSDTAAHGQHADDVQPRRDI